MEKNKKKSRSGGNNFVVQGSILAIAGILVRLIGMVYRIPLTNIIGDEGNGYYSSAYSIYSIMLIISSYSMPVAVSKMIAIRLAQREYNNSHRILRIALVYATLVGGVACFVMWFGADRIAQFNNMPFSSYAIKALAPTVWIMAYLGVLRGYFQGHGTMVPTALSQIAEQIVNAAISLVAAITLFDYGVKANLVYGAAGYSYAYGAAGGAIGTGAGALTALLLFIILMIIYRPVMRKQARKDQGGHLDSYGEITRIMFLTIVPIVVSSTIYNVSNVFDNGMYGQVMGTLGMNSKEVATTWGIYMGRYHLLFNIPVGIANAMSSSLIPSLARAVAEHNRRQTREKISTVIRFSMILSIPSAVGLMALAEPISTLLFRGMDNTLLVRMLWFGSAAVIVFSLSTVTNAVLQGINKMKIPIINASIALVLHLIILYVMLAVFRMGVLSVVYSNIIFALIVCVLNAICIRNTMFYRQEIKKTFLIPAISAVVMGLATRGVFLGIHKLVNSNIIAVLMAILTAVLVYGGLLLKLGGLDAKELESMPKGRFLARIAQKLHLL